MRRNIGLEGTDHLSHCSMEMMARSNNILTQIRKEVAKNEWLCCLSLLDPPPSKIKKAQKYYIRANINNICCTVHMYLGHIWVIPISSSRGPKICGQEVDELGKK